MKILLVTHDFVPITGGGKTPTIFAKKKKKRGHEVTVFWSHNNELKSRYPTGNYKIVEHKFAQNNDFIIHNMPDTVFGHHIPELEKRFEAVLKNFQPDIVHFIAFENLAFSLIELSKRYGAKTVFYIIDNYSYCIKTLPVYKDSHCPQASYSKCYECFIELFGLKQTEKFNVLNGTKNSIDEFLKSRKKTIQHYLNMVDLIIATSHHVGQRHIDELNIPKEKVKTIPLGLQKERFGFLQKKKSKKEKITFGYVGGVSKYKGFFDILNVFESLDVNLKIWGIGTTPMSEGSIEYKGTYLPDDLKKIYEEIDVLIHPSYYETSPLAVREALYFKKPVISYDNGGAKEILNDKIAILVPIGDVKKLKKAVLRMSDIDVYNKYLDNLANYEVKSFEEELDEIEAEYEALMKIPTKRVSSQNKLAIKKFENPFLQGVTNQKIDIVQIVQKNKSNTLSKAIMFHAFPMLTPKLKYDLVQSVASSVSDEIENIVCKQTFMAEREYNEIQEFIIFGAGYSSKRTYQLLQFLDKKIECFVDDYKTGQLFDIPIIKPESLYRLSKNTPIIFSCASYGVLVKFLDYAEKFSENRKVFWMIEDTTFNDIVPIHIIKNFKKDILLGNITNRSDVGELVENIMFLNFYFSNIVYKEHLKGNMNLKNTETIKNFFSKWNCEENKTYNGFLEYII